MKKLTFEEELSIIFSDNISKEWMSALLNPEWETEIYYKDEKPYGIVTMGHDGDVLMINSGTVSDKPFTVGMRRDILKASLVNEKVILSSIMKDSSISRVARYDEVNKCFYKGL